MRIRRSFRVRIGLVCLGAVLLTCLTAVAGVAWPLRGFPEPTVLQGSEATANGGPWSGQVAVDGRGRAVGVWLATREEGGPPWVEIRSVKATRFVGGVWGPSTTLWEPAENVLALLDVSAHRSGRVAALLHSSRSTTLLVMAPDGSWSAPIRLSGHHAFSADPLAPAPHGGFWVGWRAEQRAMVARVDRNGHLLSLTNLSGAGKASFPALSAAGGVLTALWRADVPDSRPPVSVLKVRTWRPETGWSRAQVVERKPQPIAFFRVSRSADGTVVAMWMRRWRVMVASRSPQASRFRRVLDQRVSNHRLMMSDLSVAQRGGFLLTAWSEVAMHDGGRVVHIVYLRSPQGRWSVHRVAFTIPKIRNGSASGGVAPFAVDLARHGRVLATWLGGLDIGTGSGAVMFQERIDGRWTPPALLQREGASPAMALNARGDAALLWTRTENRYHNPDALLATARVLGTASSTR